MSWHHNILQHVTQHLLSISRICTLQIHVGVPGLDSREELYSRGIAVHRSEATSTAVLNNPYLAYLPLQLHSNCMPSDLVILPLKRASCNINGDCMLHHLRGSNSCRPVD